MKQTGKLFFFFPFLKLLLKLGMQTAGSVYFALIGLALGGAAGLYLKIFGLHPAFSGQVNAISGGLGGALLGGLFAPAFFKSPGSEQSDFMLWARSISASVTMAGFGLPSAGLMAGFLKFIRQQNSIPASIGEGLNQGIQNFNQMKNIQGWLVALAVFLSGVGFRKLVNALDGPNPRQKT